MSKILTVFSAIAAHEGITVSALEKRIGASKGVLSRALKNDTDIQTKWLINLVENYPEYSPEWILTGKGTMLRAAATDGLHPILEEGAEYELREKIKVLEERIMILQETNTALKESNTTLKEIKVLLELRIKELES